MNRFIVYGTIFAILLGMVFVQGQMGTGGGSIGSATSVTGARPEASAVTQLTEKVCTAGKDDNGDEYSNNLQGCEQKAQSNPPSSGCQAPKEWELQHCSIPAEGAASCKIPGDNDVGIECSCTFECV